MLGSYAVEQDYSHYLAKVSKVIFAAVGLATKGPIGVPTLCTSRADLIRKFGPAADGLYGLYAGLYYLNYGSSFYFVRAESSDSPAVKASIVAAGKSGETAIPSAATFEAKDPGTYYNNLDLVIATDTNGTVVKVVSGTLVLETIKLTFPLSIESFKSSFVVLSAVDETATELTAGTLHLTGGENGDDAIDAADWTAAGSKLSAGSVDINVFAVPGISDATVVQNMLALAETRGDCIFLVDPPADANTPDLVKDWHNGEGTYEHAKFNSSYGALYFSWQRIYDNTLKAYITIPPSVIAAATYAESAAKSELWFPPAGVQRGLVRGVYAPVYSPDQAETDALYDGENCVNSIINDPVYGLCVFGQKTLSRSATALNRVNVRMLLNYLKRVVVSVCKYLTFEPNDIISWQGFEDLVEPVLQQISQKRGLYSYKIVKGEALVTSDDIDNYRMPCKILIQPTKSAESIPIYFTLTSTGADFNEVLEAEGIIE